jgi:hypothetical protein
MSQFQAKDSAVLGQQLKVQELCVFASNPLLSVSGGDLKLQVSEPIDQIFICAKQVVAGTLSGIHCTIGGDLTSIIITGEAAAVASTAYMIKYSVQQS